MADLKYLEMTVTKQNCMLRGVRAECFVPFSSESFIILSPLKT